MDFTRSKYGRRKRKKKRLGEYKETGFLIYLYVDEEKEKNIGEKFMNEYSISSVSLETNFFLTRNSFTSKSADK